MHSLETSLAAAAGYWLIQAVWSSLAGVFWFKCECTACWPVYMQSGQSSCLLKVNYPAGRKKLVHHPGEPLQEETEEHKTAWCKTLYFVGSSHFKLIIIIIIITQHCFHLLQSHETKFQISVKLKNEFTQRLWKYASPGSVFTCCSTPDSCLMPSSCLTPNSSSSSISLFPSDPASSSLVEFISSITWNWHFNIQSHQISIAYAI